MAHGMAFEVAFRVMGTLAVLGVKANDAILVTESDGQVEEGIAVYRRVPHNLVMMNLVELGRHRWLDGRVLELEAGLGLPGSRLQDVSLIRHHAVPAARGRASLPLLRR